MSAHTQSFWDFSVEIYAQDEVSSACLELQNEFGFDVNLILFCYWYGYSYGTIDDRLLQLVIEFSDNWKQNVVQPLRTVRKWMKLNADAFQPDQSSQYSCLRERIKDDELAAEKYQQEAVEKLILSSDYLNSSETNKQENMLGHAQFNLQKLMRVLSQSTTTSTAITSRLAVLDMAFSGKHGDSA